MPPAAIHKELSAAQKETIRRWIAEGAEYEGHWAYQPVRAPAVPARRAPASIRSTASCRRGCGRKDSSHRPRRIAATLIRRVTLDLTGLAPTPAEVDAFLADRSPRAYERVVDRLLASPRFGGEAGALLARRRSGTPTRPASTATIRYPVWPYRDYVLKRLQRPTSPSTSSPASSWPATCCRTPTVDQKIASAFNRLNRVSGEGGLQEKEYLAKYGADRVRNVSSVWMGTTVGCAECHDHKFDPILAKDFYALKAFFADLDETGLARDGGGRNGPEAWGVKLQLPTASETQQLEKLDAAIATARQKLATAAKQRASDRAAWASTAADRFNRGELRWQFVRPLSATAREATLSIHDDLGVRMGSLLRFNQKPVKGLIVASGKNPDTETYTVTLKPGKGVWRSLGIEMARDDTLPGGFVARGGLGVELSEVEASVVQGARRAAEVASSRPAWPAEPQRAGRIGGRDGERRIDGDAKTSWIVGDFGTSASNPFVAFQFAEPVTTSEDSVLVVVFRQESGTRRATIGRFGWRSRPDPRGRTMRPGRHSRRRHGRSGDRVPRVAGVADARHHLPGQPAAEDAPRGGGGRQQRGTAGGWSGHGRDFYQLTNPELASLRADVARLEAAKARLEMDINRVMVSEAMPVPRETRMLPRGNWMDDSGADGRAGDSGIHGRVDNRRPPGHAARPGELAGLAAESADRPGVRQPHVAAVLRHGPVRRIWVTSVRKGNGHRTWTCSIGLPPSSWNRRSIGSPVPTRGT